MPDKVDSSRKPGGERRDPGPIRLLFVDDEEDLRRSLATALSRRGVAVTAAATAGEGLALAQQQSFDVALVDLRMPGTGGLSLMSQLRLLDPDLELIVLTGHPSLGSAAQALTHRPAAYLMKPQNPDALVDIIETAARRRATRLRRSRSGTQRDRRGGKNQ